MGERGSVDVRFFQQPGYSKLFDAWKDVFEKDSLKGDYVLDPELALARIIRGRREAEMEPGANPYDMDNLEGIARKQAGNFWWDVAEITEGL